MHPRARAVGGRARRTARLTYLLTCPNGRSVVGGLDAQATSRDVRVSFDGRLGAPVQPGQTTTRYAFFRAVSISGRTQAFQPLLGCIPTQGGGGRSTVSARVVPVGQPLEYRSRIVVVGPGDVKFGRVVVPQDREARRRLARDRVPDEAAAEPRERRARAGAPRDRRQEGGRDRVVDRRALTRRARDRPGRRGVRAVTFCVSVSPAAARSSCPRVVFFAVVARAPARAVRGRLHEPRSARVGGGAAAAQSGGRSSRSRCSCSRSRSRLPRSRGRARPCRRRPTARPSCCSSTCPARCVRAT